MRAHTDKVQIIKQNGVPAFAVIPYADYLALTGQGDADEATIPHEVVGLAIKNGWNLAKAWRKHLGINQKELAARAGVSQPALSQMENSDNPRSTTLEKLALAMGLSVHQLTD
jgi:DNA-binding XRE family transcriptional regulator